jgi:hypothetical protein
VAIRVDVDGIPHVEAMLTALGEAAERELNESCSDSAEQVASRTRGLIPLGPVPGGHARMSVEVENRPGAGAAVTEGGARFPYVGWLDFGGRVGRHHSVHRAWIKGGRYLFRAYASVRPGVEPGMHENLRQACRETGWDPRG